MIASTVGIICCEATVLWRDVLSDGVKIAQIPAEGLCLPWLQFSRSLTKPIYTKVVHDAPGSHGFILSDLIPSKAPLEPISNLNYQERVRWGS